MWATLLNGLGIAFELWGIKCAWEKFPSTPEEHQDKENKERIKHNYSPFPHHTPWEEKADEFRNTIGWVALGLLCQLLAVLVELYAQWASQFT